jgi:mono/diheme cytochrome c family protein
MKFRIMLLCSTFVALCCLGIAQKGEVTIHAPHTSATSGNEMYMAYCATCHGNAGKSDGPVSGALKIHPADLTTLTKRNNGKFPSALVVNTITGTSGVLAHGSKEMPVWGPVFRTMEHQHESEVRLRVANLADYVKSLQQK